MPDGTEPHVLAMVVCDNIHVDPGTGKRTLLGTFSGLFSHRFPTAYPLMAVYVAMTDCRGKFPVLLQIVDVNEERDPVFRIEGEAESTDPLLVMELNFLLGNVVFTQPGEYRVQFFAAGEPLMERRLIVSTPPTPPALEKSDE
jgi:hypothetical protein